MFHNPLVGSFLSSSGAIPVKRNPNSGSTDKKVDASVSQAELFKSTTLALAADQVVGIFPEGTSYTQPSIVQVLSGAAWAAVEYTRWSQGENADGGDVIIVPVGIVYTDKSQYQSRVRSLVFAWKPLAKRPHRSAFSES
jgi:glycerol-3-phosphate O-acyltransferase / dihydroxyacetone phosphate acyltransferase